MTAATVSRVGQSNLAGDDQALFLKVFSGEVMAEFAINNVALSRTMVRTISSGKSAQFPIMGKTSAAYHTPGAEIVGTAIDHAERVITINDLLLSSVFISNIDEAMNHYGVRSHYSKELGMALSNQMDRHILNTGVQAALATATLTTAGNAGEIITDADADTNADSLIQSIFDAAQALDEKNVPESDRTVFLKPAQYYLLVNSSSKLINVDYGNSGNGSTASGKVYNVAGIDIVKTNQLPTTNVTTGVEAGGDDTSQAVDARNGVALVMHKSAIGTVKLMDLSSESEYDIRRQGTLMVSKYACGHGVLKPDSAAWIRTATPV